MCVVCICMLYVCGIVNDKGGILSCHFTLTERIHTLNFKKEKPDTYKRLGISNSLHPISMVYELIGKPSKISTIRRGKFTWHKSGSIFVGSGISRKNIPFSYHANWNSPGGWGVEVMTRENAYRLVPLEKLKVLDKDSSQWKEIKVPTVFNDVKPGLAEQIALMLNDSERKVSMVTLSKAVELNKFAEKIFGYK